MGGVLVEVVFETLINTALFWKNTSINTRILLNHLELRGANMLWGNFINMYKLILEHYSERLFTPNDKAFISKEYIGCRSLTRCRCSPVAIG